MSLIFIFKCLHIDFSKTLQLDSFTSIFLVSCGISLLAFFSNWACLVLVFLLFCLLCTCTCLVLNSNLLSCADLYWCLFLFYLAMLIFCCFCSYLLTCFQFFFFTLIDHFLLVTCASFFVLILLSFIFSVVIFISVFSLVLALVLVLHCRANSSTDRSSQT